MGCFQSRSALQTAKVVWQLAKNRQAFQIGSYPAAVELKTAKILRTGMYMAVTCQHPWAVIMYMAICQHPWAVFLAVTMQMNSAPSSWRFDHL